MYEYYAIVCRVVDGDSIELNIDLGMKIFYKAVCRLSGLNAPELNSPDEKERLRAVAARDYVSFLVPAGTKVLIRSRRLDKYGRPVAEVFTLAGVSVNEKLLQHGYAVKYE
jgi:micrococcal nuclease